MRWIFLAFFLLLAAAPASAAVAIDNAGAAKCTGTSTNAATVTCALTTTSTNDVIVCATHNELNSTQRTVSSVAGSGITGMTLRKQLLWTDSGGVTKNDLEIWYGVAAAALTAVTITVTFSGNPDDAGVVCFGLSGADTSTPWDINGSLPATATNVSGVASQATVGGVSTSSTNTMVLGFVGTSAAATFSSDTPFTQIGNAQNGGGTNNSGTAANEEVVTSAQSGISVFFAAASTKPNWGIIADAICQSGGCAAGASSAPSRSLLDVGQ